MTKLRGRSGSKIAAVNEFVVAIPRVVTVRCGKVLRDGERIAVL